ncbi:MAG TPA: phosphopentomutase, partial [Chloroflexota bacterium]|nr:phosphopentomutase [Chloroflexota bacterium]
PCATGAFGKLAERSHGKDTVIGHWELAGVYSARPQPTYPEGFPTAVIGPFTAAIGRGELGNRPASGTEIIQELGAEHLRTGRPIVYTSADSVFQLAAHTDVVALDELYRWCAIARDLLRGEHAVGRVIARPFSGVPGAFVRTADRRDWALLPPTPTLLDHVQQAGLDVVAVGKIEDIFSGRGITHSEHTHTNTDAIEATLRFLSTMGAGLFFVNLIECDMIYGHRNDPRGYGDALEAFDRRLPELLAALRENDVLMIVGDHGVDPTTPGTDHTREDVPLLVAGPCIRQNVRLGTRPTFADAGQTAADLLNVAPLELGTSFAVQVIARGKRAAQLSSALHVENETKTTGRRER